MVNSSRNEGKDYFQIDQATGWISTKIVFDREKQGAYALEVEARDGAASARPNSNGQPNSGMRIFFSHPLNNNITLGQIDPKVKMYYKPRGACST